jgi:hypothetical protein
MKRKNIPDHNLEEVSKVKVSKVDEFVHNPEEVVKVKEVKVPKDLFKINYYASSYNNNYGCGIYIKNSRIANITYKILSNGVLEIQSLDVIKDFQKKKIGTFLLLFLIDAVINKQKDTDNKINKVILDDFSANYGKPNNIYTKIGFVGNYYGKTLYLENGELPKGAQTLFEKIKCFFEIRQLSSIP